MNELMTCPAKDNQVLHSGFLKLVRINNVMDIIVEFLQAAKKT